MRPILIAKALKGFEGKWVALKGEEVVAAKETPDALRLYLHEHDIVGASMMRVPGEGEPELVGFGQAVRGVKRPPWAVPLHGGPVIIGPLSSGNAQGLRPIVSMTVAGMDDPVLALVDSGSERTLIAPWVARAASINLDQAISSITLGMGGQSIEVELVEQELRLFPPHGVDDSAVSWNAEIGVVSSNWRPPWPVLLGQIGFFDQFTICMHHHAHATAIQPFGAFDETFGVIKRASNRSTGARRAPPSLGS